MLRLFIVLVLMSLIPMSARAQGTPTASQSAAPAPSPFQKAVEFSKQGVGLLYLSAMGEPLEQSKSILRNLMQPMKQDGIPVHVYGGETEQPASKLYFFVDGAAFPKKSATRPVSEGYSLAEIQNGVVLNEVRSAFQQAQAAKAARAANRAAAEEKLRQLDASIAELDGKIAANNAKIQQNNAAIALSEQRSAKIDRIVKDLEAGKHPAMNPDGTYVDPDLEEMMVEYERRLDPTKPIPMFLALRHIQKESAQKAGAVKEQRVALGESPSGTAAPSAPPLTAKACRDSHYRAAAARNRLDLWDESDTQTWCECLVRVLSPVVTGAERAAFIRDADKFLDEQLAEPVSGTRNWRIYSPINLCRR